MAFGGLMTLGGCWADSKEGGFSVQNVFVGFRGDVHQIHGLQFGHSSGLRWTCQLSKQQGAVVMGAQRK